ncbi:2-isopropylmalate synthase [candidate division FCPU426 bacterium]|nr:2-isopropylmalate synthase [candidate division FCPU426 bacterium]
MPEAVKIFDTTLRDGEQSPGASLDAKQKVEVARALEALGVDAIEAGFPISSPGDFEAVRNVAKAVTRPIVAGLARCAKADIDIAWKALRPAGHPRLHLFLSTSPLHMQYKLKKSPEEVLRQAREMVKYARSLCKDVEFSPEDATRSDLPFLAQVVEAVIAAGAATVNIPDTVGYTTPGEFESIIQFLYKTVPRLKQITLSVHCHNDLGMATANSLAAVHAGARQVECTINGLGERAGNAALEEIVMAIKTRSKYYGVTTNIRTREIARVSRLVSTATGIIVQPNKAIVGANAFAHEAGIHQDGIIKQRLTYEIMDAKSIGLKENRLVLGKHSGRHALGKRLKELGYIQGAEELQKTFERFKELADKKKEIFDEDLLALVEENTAAPEEVFVLEHVQATSGLNMVPTAAVRLLKQGKPLCASATGDGPVDAVYKAIDRIVGQSHRLVSYSIQAITGGTDAQGEVTVQLAAYSRTLTGRGAHTDIIVASAKAYVNALNRMASLEKPLKPGGKKRLGLAAVAPAKKT